MKVKYLSVLFLLFLCEFAIGQVPGMPKILGKSLFPQVFTLSVELNNFSSALVKAQVVNNGQTNVTESGIIWGTSVPTISSATANGTILTRTGSGSFTGTITLNTLSPRPSSLQTYYIVVYAKNAAGTAYGNVITYEHGSVKSPITGRTWLAYNLGASNIPSTMTDRSGMGDLFQWGRAADGHQIARPTTLTTFTRPAREGGGNVQIEVPANGFLDDEGSNSTTVPLERQPYFYVFRQYEDRNADPIIPPSNQQRNFGDWIKTANGNLWQGVNGINNPCPTGYRLPTIEDFQSETQLSNSTNAYASFLKMPTTGFRNNNTNFNKTNVGNINTIGYYWTSNTSFTLDVNNNVQFLQSSVWRMTSSSSLREEFFRGVGNAVRCIKD
jgi:uncharacterized protein (TIGR02145 family)